MQREGRDLEQDIDLLGVSGGILCEFLEVAFHLILYVREVYPSVVFERRKKYNVPVQMCCHPELNQYILDVLQTIKPLLEKGEIQRVALVISDKDYTPIERFVFEIGDVEHLCTMPGNDNFLLHTEKALRGFLLKISTCDALLVPNPPDCTFAILVFTKESAFLKLQQQQKSQEFPWVKVDEGITSNQYTMIPLKSASSSVLKMQLFVERSEKKKRSTR